MPVSVNPFDTPLSGVCMVPIGFANLNLVWLHGFLLSTALRMLAVAIFRTAFLLTHSRCPLPNSIIMEFIAPRGSYQFPRHSRHQRHRPLHTEHR